MKFTVPVTYTISGWIEINADDVNAARKKAEELNDAGISIDIIEDRSDASEVHVMELNWDESNDDNS